MQHVKASRRAEYRAKPLRVPSRTALSEFRRRRCPKTVDASDLHGVSFSWTRNLLVPLWAVIVRFGRRQLADTHMPLLDWNDLHLLLTIAEAGSLNAAAGRLSVAHTTVLRRLAAIEQQMGVPLFERSASGQALTAVVRNALPALMRMSAAAYDVERGLASAVDKLAGTLRVTTTDTLAVTILGDLVAGFRQVHPDITVEWVISNTFADLTKREADIAIRPSSQVPETLIGRRAGVIRYGVYCASQRCGDHAMSWIGLDQSLAASVAGRWLAEHAGKAIVARCDSLVAVRELVAAGVGKAVLPRYLGDPDHRLVLLEDIEATSDLWVLAHADLARSTRVLAFTGFAFDYLRRALPISAPN